jgi:excisionase family DNA binding protein
MADKASRVGNKVFISQAETGALLGVTDRTVRNMIADGRLKAYRIGRTIRLRLDEVETALEPFGGGA